MSETFSPHSTIAQYTIVSKIGEGGILLFALLLIVAQSSSAQSGRIKTDELHFVLLEGHLLGNSPKRSIRELCDAAPHKNDLFLLAISVTEIEM